MSGDDIIAWIKVWASSGTSLYASNLDYEKRPEFNGDMIVIHHEIPYKRVQDRAFSLVEDLSFGGDSIPKGNEVRFLEYHEVYGPNIREAKRLAALKGVSFKEALEILLKD